MGAVRCDHPPHHPHTPGPEGQSCFSSVPCKLSSTPPSWYSGGPPAPPGVSWRLPGLKTAISALSLPVSPVPPLWGPLRRRALHCSRDRSSCSSLHSLPCRPQCPGVPWWGSILQQEHFAGWPCIWFALNPRTTPSLLLPLLARCCCAALPFCTSPLHACEKQGRARTSLLGGLGCQLFPAPHRWAGALASIFFHAYPWWTRWFDTFPLPRWASTPCSSLLPSPPPFACPSAPAPWIFCCRLSPGRPRRHWQKYRH